MSTNLILRSGRNFKNKLWQKQKKFIMLPVAMHHIKIPPRIERGPTDILKALSSTIKPEPYYEEYKFRYSKSFNISSVYKMRVISLAMESGRKAAKWVVAENPALFQHRSADPYIEAFAPPKVFDENSEVSEEILIQMITEINVKSAIKVYELLKEKGVDVSNSTKQQLLELTCFYNCEDRPDITLVETKYFKLPERDISNTWNSEGFSMKLFKEMERNSESYSAIILGMFKYNNPTDALALYQEAEDEGITFDVDVYNAVLANSAFESHQYLDQKEKILTILKKMEDENIEPNLETLNSTLKSIVDMRKWFKSREFAWSLYSEFTRIGIKPSLATYYYLLQIFLDKSNTNDILNYILNRLETEELIPQDLDDCHFFPKAMEKCAYNFQSPLLAYRVNNLLNTGRNNEFFWNHFGKSVYYRCYLRVLFENESLDKTMEVYSEIVPAQFLPDVGTFLILLEQMKKRNAIQCLPRIWSDVKRMTASDSAKIIGLVMTIIDTAGSETTREQDLEISKEIWEKVDTGEFRTSWSSELVSSFLRIFSLAEDKDLSYKAFDFANFQKAFIALDFSSLNTFMKLCVKIQNKQKALTCLEYAVNVDVPNIEMLKDEFIAGFTLDKKDILLLEKLRAKSKSESEEAV